MSKTYRRTGPGSRAVLAQACSAVSLQPLEKRTLLAAAGLALDWGGIDNAYEVAVDGRGRVVVTGDSDNDLIMARFTRSGDELDLDASFGTDGGVALDFEPFGIEVQPDGKIVLVGDDAEGTLLVARYNEDGTVDTSFADDGTAEFNVVPDSLGNAIAVQPDGKIVAAGAAGDDFLVVRFERDGDLDTSFGIGGYVTTDFNGGVDEALGLGILPDGRIAVGGSSDETDYAVVRYLPSGALDVTLDGSEGDHDGGDGRISGPFQDADALFDLPVSDFAALPDGRMFLIGHGDGGPTDDGVIYPLAPDGRVLWEDIDRLLREGPNDEIDADGYAFTYASTYHDESTATEDNHNHDFAPGFDFGGDDLDGLEFDEYVLGVAVRDGTYASVGYSGDDWGVLVSDRRATRGSYVGAPHQPGATIQAEDFDYGGQGVGYHDSGVTNQGGEYRVGGVDIGFTSDTGGGFAVGWTEAGEWLEYTIDVPEAGLYAFETRIANPAPGAKFHFEVDGTDVSGPLFVPDTDGWHTFSIVSGNPVQLTAGQHVLRLAMDANATNGAIGNINWIKFLAVDDGGGEPGEGGDGDGPLDETFGEDGVTQVGSTARDDFLDVATAVGPDDKVVTVGGNLITRRLPDGGVDTSFGGGGGVVETDFTKIHDVAVQPDGKIVVVGHKNDLFRVARYTTSGQLDTTFSGDGITSRSFGGSAGSLNYATGVALQGDGKIVVVGAGTSARYTNTGLVVVRYNANGSLDTAFDNDGYTLDHLSTEFFDLATDVDIDSQGRIVVGGFEQTPASIGWVLRYTRTGSFDTSFSGDGRARVPFYVDTLDVQGDNRIVVGGWGYESMVDFGDRVGRLTAAGAMDPTFGGGDGVVENVLTVHEAYSSSVEDVLVLSGGDIMIAGWNEDRDATEPHDSSALSRLNPDGSVDTEFTGEGDRYVVVPFGARSVADSLTLQDGELIVAGSREGQHLLLARYLLEGDGGGEPGGDGTGLTGTYYSNIDFTGSSITRTDAAVNFNWGTGGPSSTIGTDTFSVRWTGQIEAEKTERYTFYTRTDDGVRLWVNGQLIIDKWLPQSATEWSGSINLVAGQKYDIRMEYFERYGGALAELRWSSLTTPKQVVPTSQLFPSNAGPADTQKPTRPPNLTATPTSERVTLDWDASTDNVGVTSYEVFRGEQRIATVPGGETSYVDEGVEPDTMYGYRVIAVDAAGNRSDPASVLTMTEPEPPTGSGGLWAVYYDNMDFTDHAFTREVSKIDFDWGRGSPDPEIEPDTFSARFSGRVRPTKTERYTFYTQSDDGVRLRVNGQTLIDKLVPQSLTEHSGTIELEAGKEYEISLDYFERFGSASVKLLWSSASTPKQVIPSENLVGGGILM